jgi:PPP family 3-phenylpropionic acid transporter
MKPGDDKLARFLLLYCSLYGAFGLVSPFLPPILLTRGVTPEQLGILLAAATAAKLICAPLAGRAADIFNAYRAELALCACLAAAASLLYLPVHAFPMVALVVIFHSAALAPLPPLSDALALSWARPRAGPAAFEYGWVRGAASAAFIAGVLLAGQAVGRFDLSSVLWLGALCLLANALCVAALPARPDRIARDKVDARHWTELLHCRAFLRMLPVAALVLGSHAMHDSFAMVRWREAGISPAITSALWSESVAAEVIVFVLLGPLLLRLLGSSAAMALAATAGMVRWAVMAQTADVAAIALIQPLHGLTFALLHLACMRIIASQVPAQLVATAQAIYGTVAVGTTTALLTLLSGWLFSRFGPSGFWLMAWLCAAALLPVWSLRKLDMFDNAHNPR